jgi:hypothetical protein
MGKVDGVTAWLGDHMGMDCRATAGSYRVAIHFTPRNLAVRPGYVPHFQVRFGDSLVVSGDIAIEEGTPTVFERVVATQGVASAQRDVAHLHMAAALHAAIPHHQHAIR